MNEEQFKRTNLIDGMPSSFDVTHVTKGGKKCRLCTNLIKKKEIENNAIIYTDDFDFSHKSCLAESGVLYEHVRPDDLSSPVKPLSKKMKIIEIKKRSKKKTAAPQDSA